MGCDDYGDTTAGTGAPAYMDDRGSGVINNGDPQTVTLSGREYERYLDGALNRPPASRRIALTAWFTGFLAGHDGRSELPGLLADDVIDLLDNLT